MARNNWMRTAGVSAILWITTASAAEFRNFALPCLAPLLEQVDSEAPASVEVAFLRGPLRAPVTRDDIGKVDFPITTDSAEAAAWFNQGIAFVHGLSNREAERSFRQALLLDPDNPMIFWGLAVANEQRPGRARLFTQQAVRRVGNRTSARERQWIDSLAHFHDIARDGPAKLPPAATLTVEQRRERFRQRIRDLEALVLANPDDLEAKAFLLRQLTLDEHRSAIAITSHVAVDRLAAELAVRAPDHPSRHYRIFLWLDERPAESLKSAETSASLAPGIADSWRYAAEAWRANGRNNEAVPLLEAAIRVDHRLARERLVMPAGSGNLGANYAALIDTLGSMGRIEEALVWCGRLLAVPRAIGSESAEGDEPTVLLGRRLLAQALVRAERFERLIDELENNAALQPDAASVREQAQWLYWRGIGLAALGRRDEVAAVEAGLVKLGGRADPTSRREIEEQQVGLAMFRSLMDGKPPENASFEPEPPHLPRTALARAWEVAGQRERALQEARQALDERPGSLLATALYCELSLGEGQAVPAMAAFDRRFRTDAMTADPGLPALDRLAPLAEAMQLPKRWMLPTAPATIPGVPAEPDELGPLEWEPASAPDWALPDAAGHNVSLGVFRGRAVLLNFFLGVNCPYCMSQINNFRPHLEAFEAAGVTMVAISTDTVEQLAGALGPDASAAGRARFPFPVLADPELATFKAYGVFDDFEGGPLHATFLVDGQGRVRWSDVGHSPFNQPEALLAEAKRLLGPGGTRK